MSKDKRALRTLRQSFRVSEDFNKAIELLKGSYKYNKDSTADIMHKLLAHGLRSVFYGDERTSEIVNLCDRLEYGFDVTTKKKKR